MDGRSESRALRRWFLHRLFHPRLVLGLRSRFQGLRQRVQRGVIGPMAELAQQGCRAFIRRGHRQREGQLVLPARTQLLIRRQLPALPQRTAPVLVARVLAIPRLDFNAPRAGVQMKPLRVPMGQPALALGGKPRRGCPRVVAGVLPIVSGSTPGLQPSPRLRSGPATVPLSHVFSWCVRACAVVVHLIHEEPNTDILGVLSRCTRQSLASKSRLANQGLDCDVYRPAKCAVSSVVEHYLDTVGVAGSNPASRTIFSAKSRRCP